jgi:hypothetical protein
VNYTMKKTSNPNLYQVNDENGAYAGTLKYNARGGSKLTGQGWHLFMLHGLHFHSNRPGIPYFLNKFFKTTVQARTWLKNDPVFFTRNAP